MFIIYMIKKLTKEQKQMLKYRPAEFIVNMPYYRKLKDEQKARDVMVVHESTRKKIKEDEKRRNYQGEYDRLQSEMLKDRTLGVYYGKRLKKLEELGAIGSKG
jgi:hypothetical protein